MFYHMHLLFFGMDGCLGKMATIQKMLSWILPKLIWGRQSTFKKRFIILTVVKSVSGPTSDILNVFWETKNIFWWRFFGFSCCCCAALAFCCFVFRLERTRWGMCRQTGHPGSTRLWTALPVFGSVGLGLLF